MTSPLSPVHAPPRARTRSLLRTLSLAAAVTLLSFSAPAVAAQPTLPADGATGLTATATVPAATDAAEAADTDVRVIAGTVFFDERTTDEERRMVSVGVTRVSDDPALNDVPVAAENISYSPDTGAFEIVSLEPGSYKLGIVMRTETAFFTPGTKPTLEWDGFRVLAPGEISSTGIDVTDADRRGLEYYFDGAAGVVSLFIEGDLDEVGDVDDFDVRAFAVNVATGEEAPLKYIGNCGAGGYGYGCTWSGTFLTGTEVFLRAETPGATAYYDGTGFAAVDVADAQVVTAGRWDSQRVRVNVWPEVALGEGGSNLTDENRGPVRAPETADEGKQLHVFVGVDWAGQEMHGFLFSERASLGTTRVNDDGYVDFALPEGVSGDHRVALMQYFGDIVGWDDVHIVAAEDPGEDTESGADGDAGEDTDADAGADADADSDAGEDTESGSDADAGTDADAGADAGADGEAGEDADAGSDADAADAAGEDEAPALAETGAAPMGITFAVVLMLAGCVLGAIRLRAGGVRS